MEYGIFRDKKSPHKDQYKTPKIKNNQIKDVKNWASMLQDVCNIDQELKKFEEKKQNHKENHQFSLKRSISISSQRSLGKKKRQNSTVNKKNFASKNKQETDGVINQYYKESEETTIKKNQNFKEQNLLRNQKTTQIRTNQTNHSKKQDLYIQLSYLQSEFKDLLKEQPQKTKKMLQYFNKLALMLQ